MGTNDPYVVWKKTIYAWMICCKRTKMFNGRLTKDIALMIARLVLPDLSGEVYWSKRFQKARLIHAPSYFDEIYPDGSYVGKRKFRWIWVTSSIRYPCPECLRPVSVGGCCSNPRHKNIIRVLDNEIERFRESVILPRCIKEP